MSTVPNITLYAETLNQANQWVADNAYSFEMIGNNTPDAFPFMLATYEGKNAGLFSLLSMNLLPRTYPFSFAARGFPNNCSKEVKALWLHDTAGKFPTYLTREDMESKLSELLIIPNFEALVARPHLEKFMGHFEKTTSNSKHQRFVFWFN